MSPTCKNGPARGVEGAVLPVSNVPAGCAKKPALLCTSSGKIAVSVNQRFDLAEAADAFRALTGRQTTGVTLLETGL